MSTFNLQEMYLTEYNRLIKALQDNFDALKKCTTIEQVVDWLYANAKNNQTISEIDLDGVAFIDVPNAEYSYTQGGKSIKLIKHDNLTAGNIRSGISIEGITGSLVDGSKIIKLTELNSNYEGVLKVQSKLGSGIPYYYYDDTNNNISFVTGTAQLKELTDAEKIEGMIYDTVNEKFKFQDTDVNKQAYYKNVSVSVPRSEVTTNTDSWTISTGYNPNQYTLERLSADNKNELKGKLEYNKTFLGVTGDNINIINTTVLGADAINPNHIIVGQKYFRNGQSVSGGLSNLSQSSMTYLSDDKYDTSFIPAISDTHAYTYLRIPGNSYTHNDWYFDISNLKPENIRSGIKIMGVSGTAAIYNSFPGPYSIQLGEDFPSDLNTANYNLDSNISFNIDNTVINPKNIRAGIKILGQTGNFTANDGALNYIEYSPTDSTGTDNNGQSITYRETDDIKNGRWAFMDGQLCKGTNISLTISSYTGNYEISLGSELPLPLPTTDKALYNDITFKRDSSIIKKEAIAYGSRILGVDGEFTYCTTNPATSDKIVQDYVAYVNGVEVSGSSPEYDGEVFTTIKGDTLLNGFYNGVHIKPLYAEINGNVYAASSTEGRDTIAGFLREGVTLYSGRSGDSISGTGKLIFTANDSTQANDYLNNATYNEIVLYKGEDDGIFIKNNYLEVVTENEIGLVGTAPAFDPLIKARSLIDGDITANTVLDGKIGYGYRGERIVGAIPVLSAENQKLTISATDSYWDENTSKTYDMGYYSNGPQVIIDKTTISPSNIKHGEKIFGVEGTYSPNVQPKNITWQRAWSNEVTFEADSETPDPIDGYNEVTVKVGIGTATNIFTENNKTYKIDDEPNTNLVGWNEVNVQIPVNGVLEHTILPSEVSGNMLIKTFSKTGDNADKEAWQTAKITVPLKNELEITNGTNKITDCNLTYTAANYQEGTDTCIGFKKVKLNLTPKLYNLTGTNKITSNGAFNIADYSSYDGFGNIEVNVTPTLHTKTITWAEIVDKQPINASTTGITGWNTINFSYTEDNVKQNAEQFLETITLGLYHNGTTTTPSSGAIGFSSVTLDISTIERIISKNDIINGTKITPNNALFKAISFDVTATNHEITVEEIQNGTTIDAPANQLFKQISFSPDVTSLITPEDTTATSDQIVFGATAVLDGVLTTGTMAPIKLAEDVDLHSYTFYTMNASSEPYLRAGSTKLRQLNAGTASTEQIFLTWWPSIWESAATNTNINIFDSTITPTTSSSITITTPAIGIKNRTMRSSIEENNYFSQLGEDIDIPLQGISITYSGSVYDENTSSMGFVRYDSTDNSFTLAGTSQLPLTAGSNVSSSFTNVTLKSNYIYNKEVFEFVKLFTMTRLIVFAPSISIDKTSPHPVPVSGWAASKTYKNLPQYVICEGKAIDTTVTQSITGSTPIGGSVNTTQGSGTEGPFSYSCYCDGDNTITFTYTYSGTVSSNFKGTVNFTHSSEITW